MASHRWSDLRDKRSFSPEALARIKREARREVFEMTLRALRESTGKTQEEMARLMLMSQPQLSRVERRDDHLLSTIRRYVEALGGEIEIVAVVNGKRIKLLGV